MSISTFENVTWVCYFDWEECRNTHAPDMAALKIEQPYYIISEARGQQERANETAWSLLNTSAFSIGVWQHTSFFLHPRPTPFTLM